MKKKFLILLTSFISALVLFVCISFNTCVYAYDVDSESSYSKSVTYLSHDYNNIFSYSSDSYVVDDITHYSLKYTNVSGSAQSSRADYLHFQINEDLISSPYVLLLNYSNASLYTSMYRGDSGTATSYSYTLNYNNEQYTNISGQYYSNSYAIIVGRSFIDTMIVNNNDIFRLRFNITLDVNESWELYNIDFIPISQLSSSLYFVNYASGLQSMYDTLLSDYNDLEDSYEDLESDYSTLESSYNSLESQYDTLLSNYNTLQNNYNDLVDNYSEMFQQYEDLQSEFESLSQAVDDIRRYSYLSYLFNDVPVYTLANIDWHDVTYNYYRSDVTSAKQLIDTLNKDYTYTQDSGYWYYDKLNLAQDSQKIVFASSNIPNDLGILANDSNFVDLLSPYYAYYFDISNIAYNGYIEMLFDSFNWSEILYNYTIQVLYENNEVVTYDLSSYLSNNDLALNSEGYSSLGFKLEPSVIGIYIKADYSFAVPNSLYIATDTWYYNSGYSAGVQSQATTISNLSSRITDLNNVIVTLRKTIQNKDEQISNNFGWQQFFGGMADIPFLTIFNFMNVDILGFNLFHMFAGIITAIAMLWLIKRLYK